jgi:hypothetical protein
VKDQHLECADGPCWDLMLSYRRKKYASVVAALADLGKDAGLRCWLDLKDIDQRAALPEDDLQSTLRYAAAHSRIVVGFADEDSLAMDSGTEPMKPVFNWRLYEHQFAREFVWVRGSFLCSPMSAFLSTTFLISHTT